ncbi:hypothetical protein CAPTEDRAFT_174231 [Capitella teleta]|uniref:Uncharacterized protein n=1 Tax=Capitella teleta TaxID=283909 RepID=R7T369_CAPTE|nr:hypothetical protein CAPTEDRAFT_174231 [Capitella teleta]|eukprot:ELT87043.1 hypothetical protein CAPTEDRAFT_174231 [Capitella teleta]
MERSAHRETIEALEASENTYLTLLRGLASVLEMDDVEGLRSMAHIPKDERIKLTGLREQAVELLASRVKVLKERITRKDELLQGYERDLAKLRQAEKLAQHKTSQLDSLVDDVRSKSEEAQYLRESLHRTRDRLDQEKRLNSAVKSKKTFHLERENHSRNGWAKHHCPPEDVMGKAKASKKIIAEKMKRKNYEITTLKTELSTRERDLHGARRRLTQLENTPVSDRDPQEPPAIESH